MNRPDDWEDPMSTFVLVGIVFGFITLMVIAETIPFVAALVVFGLGFVGALAWLASNRFGGSDDEAAATREREPIGVLKERYARGELSETEFERRVTTLLDVDELAEKEQEVEVETA